MHLVWRVGSIFVSLDIVPAPDPRYHRPPPPPSFDPCIERGDEKMKSDIQSGRWMEGGRPPLSIVSSSKHIIGPSGVIILRQMHFEENTEGRAIKKAPLHTAIQLYFCERS